MDIARDIRRIIEGDLSSTVVYNGQYYKGIVSVQTRLDDESQSVLQILTLEVMAEDFPDVKSGDLITVDGITYRIAEIENRQITKRFYLTEGELYD